MRIKALLVLSALAASATTIALPASAQGGVVRSCQQAKQDNQIGGMILGGILGGVLGSNVAASGHRGDGTALGAVLGGAVGSGIGSSSTRCAPESSGYGNGYGGAGYPSGYGYNDNPNYGGPYYNGYGGAGAGAGGYSPSPYSAAPADIYPYDAGAPQYRYGDDGYRDRGVRSHDSDRYRVDRDGHRTYNQGDDYAGTDCSEATHVVRLPDGSEVHRPIQVCRDAHYGDWQIKD